MPGINPHFTYDLRVLWVIAAGGLMCVAFLLKALRSWQKRRPRVENPIVPVPPALSTDTAAPVDTASLAAATGLSEALIATYLRNRFEIPGSSPSRDADYITGSFMQQMSKQRQVFDSVAVPDIAAQLCMDGLAALDRGDVDAFDRSMGEAGENIYAETPDTAVTIWRTAARIANLMCCKELRAERYLFICARLPAEPTPVTVEIWAETWDAAYGTRIWNEDSPWRPRARDFAVQILAPGLERLLAGPLPHDLQASRIAACLRGAAKYVGNPPAMDLCRLALRAFDAEAALHGTPEEKEWPWTSLQQERAWLLDIMYDLSGETVWLEAAVQAMQAWFDGQPEYLRLGNDYMGSFTVGRLSRKLWDAKSRRR